MHRPLITEKLKIGNKTFSSKSFSFGFMEVPVVHVLQGRREQPSALFVHELIVFHFEDSE